MNYCYNLKSAIRGGCIFWGKVALKLAFSLGPLQGGFRFTAVVGSDGIPGFGGKRFRNLLGLCLYSMAACFWHLVTTAFLSGLFLCH